MENPYINLMEEPETEIRALWQQIPLLVPVKLVSYIRCCLDFISICKWRLALQNVIGTLLAGSQIAMLFCGSYDSKGIRNQTQSSTCLILAFVCEFT